MPGPTTSFVPFKLGGSGNFSERVSHPHRFWEQFISIVLDAIGDVVSSSDRSFTVADYGTADGVASYDVIRGCLGVLRRRFGDNLPIQVLYEDQPVNDFNHVFLRAAGLLPNTRRLGEEFGNVFTIASGTSFYQQCMPDNTLDFIISSLAIHWLSQCPVEIPTELFWEFASEPYREAFRKQAERDLKQFLSLRQKELKPGGRMVLLNFIDGYQRFHRAITGIMRSLLKENTVTEAEFQNTTFAVYFRRLDEWKDMLDEMSLLRLVSHHTRDITWMAQFESDIKPESSTGSYAVLMTETIRSWSEHTMYSGLSDDRSEAEKRKLLDVIYGRLLEAICNSTETWSNNLSMLCLVIEKLQH